MKTKFLRICCSGPTIDGRTVSPDEINQMAETYDPEKYGARVNVEHVLSMQPDGLFPPVGDVLALKAEDGPDGTRILYAQIEAHDRLVQLSKNKQKIYFSAEIMPNFANSGKAYLFGLAVTDTPASLRTEALKLSFSSGGKATENKMFGAYSEDRLQELGASTSISSGNAGQEVADLKKTVTELAATVAQLAGALTGGDFLATGSDAQTTEGAAHEFSVDLVADRIIDKLAKTPDGPGRMPHDGGVQDQVVC